MDPNNDAKIVETNRNPIGEAHEMINQCNLGLQMKLLGEKCWKGSNGVYFLKNTVGENIAVFKPREEEDHSHTGGVYRQNFAIREVAGYLLDFNAFGGIPVTTMVSVREFKEDGKKTWVEGSLQQFVPNLEWAERDLAFYIGDIQRMTVVDIRYGNGGGHSWNMLMSKEGKLVLVDHGECFPTLTNAIYNFEWMRWDCSKMAYSPEIAEYVANLSYERAVTTLENAGIRLTDEEWFGYLARQMALKIGVRNGHVALDIARLLIGPTYFNSYQGGMRTGSLREICEGCSSYNQKGREDLLMGEMAGKIEPALEAIKRERLEWEETERKTKEEAERMARRG